MLQATQTWLILAHPFNMDGRAASQTITDRLPFLMARGVSPVVVSAPTGTRDHRFPHYRILSPAPSGLLFETRQVIERRWDSPLLQKSLKALLTCVLFPLYILEKLIIPLGSQWSWFFTATVLALKAVRCHGADLIYSTAGPPSTHLAGWLMRVFTGLPWIAEVHDPLISRNPTGRSHEYWFCRWIENRIFMCADAIIYFTRKAMADASSRHEKRSHVFLIRPGASPGPWDMVKYKKGDQIHFGHFGSLAEDRNLSHVVKTLHLFLKAHPAWMKKLRLHVYGTTLDSFSKEALDDYPLGKVLVEHGRLEYDPRTGKSGRQQVLEAMRSCDVLIVIHGSNPEAASYIPSKVYEYLQARRPILALAKKDTELAHVLASEGHFVINPGDKQAFLGVLGHLTATWEREGFPDLAVESPYTVEKAVQNLLKIAEGILEKKEKT
jgi:hypothetical protein